MSKTIPKKPLIITLSALGLLLFILIVSSLLIINASSKDDKIIGGVFFEDLELSGKTVSEAKALISEMDNTALSKTVNVSYNEKAISFAPTAVGFNYDIDSIVNEAYGIGRNGSKFKILLDTLKSKFKQFKIPPVYTTDSEFFKEAINLLASEQGIEFKKFEVKIDENHAKVKLTENPSMIDYDALFENVEELIKNESKANIELPVIKSEKATAKEIYDEIYIEPKDAVVQTTDGVTRIIPHQIGILVSMEEIEKKLESNLSEFDLKITKKYPKILSENLSGEYFKDVLATFTTYYNPSIVGRTTNLTLASKKVNNTILNHNDIFSFNKIVGKRTAQAGFSTATVYTNNGLQEELGGGICQVSSTLYNAALYADLKIIERRNHMYTVGYVKNGLDATVNYGLIDFKFQNNYTHPIKIVSKASGGALTITIYGKKINNNKIELYTNVLETYDFSVKEVGTDKLASGVRKDKQNGSKGYKISATKVVKDSSGNVLRSESLGTSVYKPLDQIIEVGVDANGNIPKASIIEPEPTPANGESPENSDPESTAQPSPTLEPSSSPAETPNADEDEEETDKPDNSEEPIPTSTPTEEQ